MLDYITKVSDLDVARALRNPLDFTYRGDNKEMFRTWSLGPAITSRDATTEEKTRAAKLIDLLGADPSLDKDWKLEDCSHWAVGWLIHLTYRVIGKGGKPTRVFRIIKGWYENSC